MRTIYARREPPSGLSEEVLRRFLRDEYGIEDFPAAMGIIRRRWDQLLNEGDTNDTEHREHVSIIG